MKNIIKESLKLIIVSFVCNLCLFTPAFLCDGFGLFPFESDSMYYVYYTICVVVEIVVFGIVGSKMKFSYKSLAVFYIISIISSVISTVMRGDGIFDLIMLNTFVIPYDSFAKSLIAPMCETTLKALVLLISSLIAGHIKKQRDNTDSSQQSIPFDNRAKKGAKGKELWTYAKYILLLLLANIVSYFAIFVIVAFLPEDCPEEVLDWLFPAFFVVVSLLMGFVAYKRNLSPGKTSLAVYIPLFAASLIEAIFFDGKAGPFGISVGSFRYILNCIQPEGFNYDLYKFYAAPILPLLQIGAILLVYVIAKKISSKKHSKSNQQQS